MFQGRVKALSRVSEVFADLNYAGLGVDQACDTKLRQLRANTGLGMRRVLLPGMQTEVYCNISTGKARPFLPVKYRRAASNSVNNLSHPGAKATQRLLTEKFVWPGIKKDARTWAKQCIACQKSKVSRHANPFPSEIFRCHRSVLSTYTSTWSGRCHILRVTHVSTVSCVGQR